MRSSFSVDTDSYRDTLCCPRLCTVSKKDPDNGEGYDDLGRPEEDGDYGGDNNEGYDDDGRDEENGDSGGDSGHHDGEDPKDATAANNSGAESPPPPQGEEERPTLNQEENGKHAAGSDAVASTGGSADAAQSEANHLSAE